MKKKKICSIILARGGSKGIKNKNLVLIKNKPLIYYAIKASLKSHVHETWLSSDSDKILKKAKSFGAKIIKRPKQLAKDNSTSESAILHFLNNVECDLIVFIQPTSPMISSEDINKGLKKILNYDSVISVSELHQLIWFGNKPSYNINNRKRRQLSKKTYLETGSFFITSKTNFIKYKNRISGKIGFVEIDRSRSFDIDTLEDLKIIRKLLK